MDFLLGGTHFKEDYDPLSSNLVSLTGQRWKNMRTKLTPTFSSGKLKAMFSTIVDCGSSMQSYLEKQCDKGESLDVRELAARFLTNIIASVAFGIEVDAINNPDNDFRKYGRKSWVVDTTWKSIKAKLRFLAPQIMSLLRIRSVEPDVEDFVRSIVKQNLEYREKNNVTRRDFFQLLIQLRNNGAVQLDGEWETKITADESQKTLTLDEMAAQTYIFFAAGFETSSLTTTFCLYEVVKDPDVQEKVHNEIDKVLEQSDGKITYESISKMTYLESCIDGKSFEVLSEIF